MSQGPEQNLDPFAAFRSLRDANMDVWSKSMIETVSTEAFAEGMGKWLDGYLNVSAPFRKTMGNVMTDVLAHLNMPSRDEVMSIAERLTNIEMRLDDLDARFDTLGKESPAARPAARSRPVAKKGK
jgi:hypothetical protein